MTTTFMRLATTTVVVFACLLVEVKAQCWEYCGREEVPGWVCRHENACSNCTDVPEVSCSTICDSCPYTLYGGAACSCEPPDWSGDCLTEQINPGDENTAQVDWFNKSDTFFFPRRDYLFQRSPNDPISPFDDTMIAGALYTLSEGTLKMTTILPPLYPSESRTATLIISNGMSTTCTIKEASWHCLFRIDGFPMDASHTYEIQYQPAPDATTYSLTGAIPQQQGLPKVAALGCFGPDQTANKDDFVAAVSAQSPDLIVLQGDQTYFHQQLLYGFFELVYSLRDILKDVPTIVQMDDHDYGVGNLWGAERSGENSGVGFHKPPCIMNMAQDQALGHLPDPKTDATLDSGITVHYTNYVYDQVDFAILEARKFKSYNDDGTILGTAQENWLRTYCNDNTKIKVVLSQTPFAHTNTNFYYSEGKLQSSMGEASKDSNGFPFAGRQTVMEILSDCGSQPVVVLSGDIHMSVAVSYDDYGVSECASPAAINDVFWRLSFHPLNEPLVDVHGNNMRLLAVWNVEQSVMDAYEAPRDSQGATNEQKAARGDGFLMFDMTGPSRTCTAYGYRTGTQQLWSVDLPAAFTPTAPITPPTVPTTPTAPIAPPTAPIAVPSDAPISPPSDAPVSRATEAPIAKAPPSPATAPPEPTGPCSSGCLADSKQVGWCSKTTGCEGCPVESTCQKLCSRCVNKDQFFGGLDCGDCTGPPVTPAPVGGPVAPTPPPVPTGKCIAACTAESGQLGVCSRTDGACLGCEVEEACPKLCTRCEGRDQSMGGLDCNCSGEDPPAPVTPAPVIPAPVTFAPVISAPVTPAPIISGPVTPAPIISGPVTPAPIISGPVTPAPAVPTGPCWNDCSAESDKTWLCTRTAGCQGCPLEPTCARLCNRCGPESQKGGLLGCDCSAAPTATPTPAPVLTDCFGACTAEENKKWICDPEKYTNIGCRTCDDPDDVCSKLCQRCGLPPGENLITGLTCNCP